MVKIKNLSKRYQLGNNNFVDALKDVSAEIQGESLTAIIGPSGSGKSTLMNILGGLDNEYTGSITVDKKELRDFDLNFYRREKVQTIFQRFFLVPSLSVIENVTLPVTFGKQYSKHDVKERAEEILEKVGLQDRMHHLPSQLSGGQAQRVAIARALLPNPDIILADEPTGNLDSKTGEQIMDLLMKINNEEKKTVIIITHDVNLIDDIDKKIHLLDGKISK